MAIVAPYGSWRSPITADALVTQAVGLSDPIAADGRLVWNERRPDEGARQVLVARNRHGITTDLIPPPYSARTRVHEYGGACVAVGSVALFFVNDADQRVYRVGSDGAIEPVTPDPDDRASVRYADLTLSPDERRIYAVRERHLHDRVENDLVLLDPLGMTLLEVVAEGHDFYAAPRSAPDGSRLAYLAWDHPDMPWDSSILFVAELDSQGRPIATRELTGGRDISISEPRFAPDGTLCFLSDASGYWVPTDEEERQLAPGGFDYGGPDWVFGQASYAFGLDGSLWATRFDAGSQQLGRCELGSFRPLALPYRTFSALIADGDHLVALAGSPSTPSALVSIDPNDGSVQVLRRSRELDPAFPISSPREITFTGGNGAPTHALFYQPTSAEFTGPADELPPLIVLSHGGPTSMALPTLDLGKQFFTSRGIGVVDVNYGGSSGYGRAYRSRLEGQWGILDVADCVAAARFLAVSGEADPARFVIRGGSAGGFTTLAALATTDVFAAGSSHYGVSDLTTLATDTHKFESRYLDRLVGAWPEAAAVYRDRSPLTHADAISCPVIFFQGDIDPIVPPDQAQMMVNALRRRKIPVAYLEFTGESHGFRQAATIRTVALAELTFLGVVLGFEPDLSVELDIANIDGAR